MLLFSCVLCFLQRIVFVLARDCTVFLRFVCVDYVAIKFTLMFL